MQILLIILTFGLSLFAAGHSSIYSKLEAHIDLTAHSKSIIWIKVTKKERSAPYILNGIKYEPFTIKGTIKEVIRGRDKKINWKHHGNVTKTIDKEAADKAYAELFSLWYDEIILEKEGSDCEVGKYYLVIYALGKTFFVEAPIKDQVWRKEIKPLSPRFKD